MTGFTIRTNSGVKIRFNYYSEAPVTSQAFNNALPFTQTFYHARVSGEEIWTDKAPALDIIQENSTVFIEPGEVVIGPLNPSRSKVVKCMGIMYGEGKLLDSGNIFAKVHDEDMDLLKELGGKLWEEGFKEVTLEKL